MSLLRYLFAARIPQLLWPLLTSWCIENRVYSKTSPGKSILFTYQFFIKVFMNSLRSVPSVYPRRIYLNEFWYSLGFTMMCLLTRSFRPHIRFTPVGREIASLSSVRRYRLLLITCLNSKEFVRASPLQSRFLQCLPHGKPPCDLLTVTHISFVLIGVRDCFAIRVVTPAHKGLAPWRINTLQFNRVNPLEFAHFCNPLK